MNLSKKLLLASLVVVFISSPLRAMVASPGTAGTVEAPATPETVADKIEKVEKNVTDKIESIAGKAAQVAGQAVDTAASKLSEWLNTVSENKGKSAIITGAAVVVAYAGYRGYKYLKKKSENKEKLSTVWTDAKNMSC